MCLSSSSFAGYYYKNKINTEKEIYNKNIDEYNKNYNMNYYNNKVYYTDDLKNMNETVATVISGPEIKAININNRLIELFKYTINYKAINYLDEETKFMKLSRGFEEGGTVSANKKVNMPLSKNLNITADIITTSRIENKQITVYYNYGTNDRFAPPFLPEKYITYLQKK